MKKLTLLCLMFLLVVPLFGAQKKVVSVANSAWSDALEGTFLTTNPSGVVTMLEISNCPVGPVPQAAGQTGQTFRVEKFRTTLCVDKSSFFSLVTLNITNGDIDLHTVARYSDPRGVTSLVDIPALGDPIPTDKPDSYYEFRRASVTKDVGTYLAIFADQDKSPITVELHDALDQVISTDYVFADRSTWYEVKSPYEQPIGRVLVYNGFRCRGFGPCPSAASPVYAVQFVGTRVGGSPQVELPILH